MAKIMSFWTRIFIPFLLVGMVSCAGMKPGLKEAPREGISQRGISEPQPKVTAFPSKPEASVSGAKAEVSQVEKLAEPQIPTQRSEGIFPTPTPTPQLSPTPHLPIKLEEPQKGSRFVLNFDNADLYEVVRVMAEMMKINYTIDPKVKGVVNIYTAGRISAEDVFPILQSILKLNGATAVKKDNLYEIIPLGDAKKSSISPLTPGESGKSPLEEKYIIQILSLKYIPVAEVSKMIKPFLSDGADIVEHPPHNILIIGDLASNIKKSLDIIGLFDIDIFADLRVRIYPILHADVAEIAKEMERIFSSFEVSLKSARGVGITFTPIARVNSLLVVSSIPHIFEKVERWLKELDKTPMEGMKLSVFVYYVQNAKAKDLAEVLKQIYVPAKEKKVDFKEKVVTPEKPTYPRGVKPPPAPTTPAGPAKEEEGAVPEGEINIVVDETTNSLIIRAIPRDYKAILETIKKLDLYPKQVLIEVLLAEVTLDDLTKYGLEFSTFTDTFVKGGRSSTYTVGVGGIGESSSLVSGIRYSIASANRLTAAIHASATENRLKVISSPHILASNNKEAKIQIGTAQPILTSTYTTTATSATNVVEGTIEYKDVGIILTVTPRISDAKLVTMEISIEDSKVETTTLGNLPSIPVFRKKTAKTTLSIMEGQTIVIGGLIEESKNVTKSGVPFLSRIPILGALFGYHTYDTGKTETVLLMTPRVITDLAESIAVTEDFRDKVEGLKKELEKRGKKEKKDRVPPSLNIPEESPRSPKPEPLRPPGREIGP
jgi:general secretion pathway protein D